MKKNEIVLALVLVCLLALTRFFPHPMNFTPIIAMGLLSGMIFKVKSLRWLVPMGAMLVSDLMLGFHNTMLSVYGAIALVVVLGIYAPKWTKNIWLSTGLGAFFGSVLFFLVTNFQVWLVSGFYTKNISGLLYSYVMALPFFHNTLAATFLFSFSTLYVYKKVTAPQWALNK